MPWSDKQMKTIRAIKHGWVPPKGAPFHGQSRAWAAGAAKEGIKRKRRLTAREQAKALRG